MINKDCKIFNLNEHRPKVLLTGNGMTYSAGLPWHELIRKVARKDRDIKLYEKDYDQGRFVGFHVPNTVLTLATSEQDDSVRHRKYGEAFQNTDYTPNRWINALMDIPFDAVLTTNYTYELETAILQEYPQLTPESKRKYAYQTGNKKDNKYLIHTYNRLQARKPDIWHIHGELRRPSSIILSHDEYARMIHHIILFNEDRGIEYAYARENLKFESWIDYFLMGDVYILGLSLDYSDFDLWWMLGRRLRENTECGGIYFFEPGTATNYFKLKALSDSGVEVCTCGISIQSDKDYDRFYDAAIQMIGELVR